MADDRLGVVVRLDCEDGSVAERLWTNFQVLDGQGPRLERINDFPDWLSEPDKIWLRPQDPICFTGRVAAGHEDEAHRWVAAL